MYKDYKEIIKNLRDMQDQMWKDSIDSFPGSAFSTDMNDWQQKTLGNVNNLVVKAVNQSLELQREWVDQWTERAGGKKLKPKMFAELSAEASKSTQRWLDYQHQLWDQWLEVLRDSRGPGGLADFAEWEKAVEESMQRQMGLLSDWSEIADGKKLSVKEATELSTRVEKAMQKSIETQQRLWSHWFDGLGAFGAVAEKAAEKTATAEPKRKKAKATVKRNKAVGTSAQTGDDLKQVNGIGPGLENKLKDAGILTLKQIAELSGDDIARLEDEVVRFSGRIKRDQWVQQAKKLIS